MSLDVAYDADAPTRREPWMAYLLILAVFWFVMPFDVLHSVRYLDQLEFTNVDVSIESIEQGSVARRLAMVLLATYAFFGFVTGRAVAPRLDRALGVVVTLFMLWSVTSLAWSEDVALTVRRLTLMMLLSFGALGVATRLTLHEVVRFTFLAGAFLGVAGLACELVLGTFRPWDTTHRFGGLINPVYLGINFSLFMVAALALHQATQQRIYVVVAILAVPFLVMTRSRVPAAAAIAGVAAFWALTSTRGKRLATFAGAVLAACALVVFAGDTFFAYGYRAVLLGRETSTLDTLTGRLPLWSECIRYFLRNPLFGYGYDTFWIPKRIAAVTDATGFPSVDTHNAYLEWLLGLGIPGAALGVTILVLASSRTITFYRETGDADYAFAFAALLIFCINVCSVAIHLHHIATFIVLVLIAKLAFNGGYDPGIEDEGPFEERDLGGQGV